jgi:hypothetical protein
MLKEIAHLDEIMLYMEKWKNIYYGKIADILKSLGKNQLLSHTKLIGKFKDDGKSPSSRSIESYLLYYNTHSHFGTFIIISFLVFSLTSTWTFGPKNGKFV